MKRTIIWIAALVVGAILGLLGIAWLDEVMNFVAAVITTFATFGSNGSGKIFGHTLTYTLLTTFAAAAVGAALYVIVAPGLLPLEALSAATVPEASASGTASYADHLLSVIPNNIVRPFLEGNVLSLLLLAFAVGIGLSKLPESENKAVVVKGLLGLQDLLFLLIRWLIWTLPRGRFHRQIRAGGVGRQRHPVLCGTAIIPVGKRTESCSRLRKNDACRADGALHEE